MNCDRRDSLDLLSSLSHLVTLRETLPFVCMQTYFMNGLKELKKAVIAKNCKSSGDVTNDTI